MNKLRLLIDYIMYRGILTKPMFDYEIEQVRTIINEQLDYIKDNVDTDSDNNVSIAEIVYILRYAIKLIIKRFKR